MKRLLTTPTVVVASVLLLAGCGGGGSNNETPPTEMPLTPKEECLAGDGVIYEDGKCKTAEDLRKEGRDAEKESEDAKARLAMAKKLHGLLSPVVDAALATPVPTSTQFGDEVSLTDARDEGMDESTNGNAKLMVMNTRGDGNQVDTIPTANTDLTALANARHIRGAGFATRTNQILSHNNMKGHGDRKVTGSYLSAMGVFTCPETSNDCTSQQTDNDGIKLSGTGWTFTPNTGQKYTVPDANYAEYGWWINEGLAADPKVGVWYAGPMGAALATNVDVTNATGSATYTGTAIGQAAYYHSQGDDLNVGGEFTADAELKAAFGATATLSGTIANFNFDGMDDPGWVVTLKGGAVDTLTSGTVGTDAETTTTWKIDGKDGDPLESAWSAQFYDIPEGMHQPTGVAGGFKAQYDSDGYMVGAFGAEQ